MEWEWRAKERGVDDPGGNNVKTFDGEDRQLILDMANADVLPPRRVEKIGKDASSSVTQNHYTASKNTSADETGMKKVHPAETQNVGEETAELTDAPLVRIYNFLRAFVDGPSNTS